MFTRQTQIDLIKYEIEHIRYFDKQAQALEKIFGQLDYDPIVPCNDYAMYSLILDDLGVPIDKGYPGRDAYWNLYLDVWSCEEWDTQDKNKIVNNLINDVLIILKEGKRSEKKKRIRK